LAEGQRGAHGTAAREEEVVAPLARRGREEGEGGHGLVGWLGLLGRSGPIGWMSWLAIGPKVEENFFSDKNWIFEYAKALEICTRRFMRNLDTTIFPKFF
jgi:hypothetical protein